jgi:hypothetical protein
MTKMNRQSLKFLRNRLAILLGAVQHEGESNQEPRV